MENKAVARAFATLSIVGLVVAVVASVIGHIGLGPGYNPLQLTISDYALSDRGSAIEVAMVALSVGSLALLAALGLSGVRIRLLPTILMAMWSVGLVIAAMVPTDPIGTPVMSTAAYIHRYTSVGAFLALPVAAAVIAARLEGAWARCVVTIRRLCVTCGVGLILFWYVAFPGHRVMLGLVERGLVGVEIGILAVLSFGVVRVANRMTARVA